MKFNFFCNLSDKAIFEEKMKSFINGLLDKIIFYFNEKEKKEKEKSEEIFYFRTKSKKKTEDNRRKKGDSIIKEIILPDLSVKNIVKIINSTENFDVTKYPPRERNKTIAKRNRNNFLKAKENEKQKDNEIMEKSELKFITKESSNKIINYLNEKMIQKKKIIDNEKDISDFKYFFLLLICLSYKQIEILNNTQNSNMPMVFYKNLPILFSKKFKNSLNPSQRNMFNKLRVLSLIRCKVLKDASKPISVNNINYNIFHSQINFDDFKLKQYSHIQEVIKEVNNSKYLSRTPDINEIKKRHLKKLVSYNSLRKRNSNRNSFCEKIDENQENPQDSSNNEQSHLYKKLEFDNDSYDDNDICEEDEQNIINYEDNFKYKEQYDIKKLRQLLKEKIINDKKYSNDEKDLYIELINSNIFIELMNHLKLSHIKELENDLETLIEFVKLYNMKLEEEESFIFEPEHNQKLKNKSYISQTSSSHSLEIDIEDKNIIHNNIRRTCIIQKPKFHINMGFSERNLPSLNQVKEENNINTFNTMDYTKNNNQYSKSKTFNIRDEEKDGLYLEEVNSEKNDSENW